MKKQNIKVVDDTPAPEIPQEVAKPTTAKITKKIEKFPKVSVLPPAPPVSEADDETDDAIEKPPPKQKRTPSAKQIENLQKGREKRDAIRRERMEANKRAEEERQRLIEEKIVKKAIQVKKRQLRQEKLIEPDDEYEDGEPPQKPRLRRSQAIPQPPQPRKPQIIYV